MRPHLAFLLLAALSAPPATAGEVVVDPFMRTVETSRFRMTFDYDRPELVRSLYFKDWNPTRDLAGENGPGLEFWGQSLREVSTTGFVVNNQLEDQSWEVLTDFGAGAALRVWSQSLDQPPVTTLYRFLADQPWFVVERTVHFSQRPDSAACQLYAPRVSFVNSYRALRWRDVSGAYVQRGYCPGGCETPSWDGRWLEHISIAPTDSFSVAQVYPDSTPPGTPIVRGSGPESYSGWVAPLVPAGWKDTDLTTRILVAFSTTPGDTAVLDSLWTLFNDHDGWTLAVAPPAPPARLALAASPNPAAGAVRLAWTMAAPGRARLEVLDAAGRRVALPLDAALPAGPASLAWDGRDDAGRETPPGVYLARLATPAGVATRRIARVR